VKRAAFIEDDQQNGTDVRCEEGLPL